MLLWEYVIPVLKRVSKKGICLSVLNNITECVRLVEAPCAEGGKIQFLPDIIIYVVLVFVNFIGTGYLFGLVSIILINCFPKLNVIYHP